MKKWITVPMLLLMFSAWGQTKPVKIVFDVTSKDEATHQAVMRHVTMMAEAYPDSEFAVVVYGGALPMFMKRDSAVEKDIAQCKNNKNVSFIVCEGTMKRYNAKASELLQGIKTVPDGILEIAIKQSEGWSYIKESH